VDLFSGNEVFNQEGPVLINVNPDIPPCGVASNGFLWCLYIWWLRLAAVYLQDVPNNLACIQLLSYADYLQ
jgi:hypothetical protein